MNAMSCTRLSDCLDAYLDGDLPAAELQQVEDHLRSCTACSDLLARERALERTLHAQPVNEPSAGFFEQAIARAASEGTRSRRRTTWAVGLGAALAATLAMWFVVPHLRAPEQAQPSPVAIVTLTLNEVRTVNLVFASATEIQNARLSLSLPPGVALASHQGRQEVRWKTRLRAGKNVLPLELVLQEGSGGNLIARLDDGRQQKTFYVRVAIAPPRQGSNADDRSKSA